VLTACSPGAALQLRGQQQAAREVKQQQEERRRQQEEQEELQQQAVEELQRRLRTERAARRACEKWLSAELGARVSRAAGWLA
jgi:hypothetical protein